MRARTRSKVSFPISSSFDRWKIVEAGKLFSWHHQRVGKCWRVRSAFLVSMLEKRTSRKEGRVSFAISWVSLALRSSLPFCTCAVKLVVKYICRLRWISTSYEPLDIAKHVSETFFLIAYNFQHIHVSLDKINESICTLTRGNSYVHIAYIYIGYMEPFWDLLAP